jgi:isochorismate synthase
MSAPIAAADDAEKLGFERWKALDWPPGPEYRVRSDRAHSVFADQIDLALEAIDAGRLDKAVLARSLRVDHDGRLDIPGFLDRLSTLYPSCTLLAMGRGNDTFLAATPETLIRVQHDRIETAALAGSAPRGRTPEEDADLARSLETSAKERAEHAHVVDALRDVLGPLCFELEVSEQPRLRQLFGIQHLETPISGRLRSMKGEGQGHVARNPLLRLVAALHPTPAVGGVPRDLARDWLRRYEGLDRGWYASPVGWLDASGGGDFCVALRSALIRDGEVNSTNDSGSRAWLFAGAGIVAGSRPEQEIAETRVKLRALLAPLTEI